MTRKSKVFSSLTKFARQRPTVPELFRQYQDRKNLDDRALAIVEGARLESSLEDALLYHMIHLTNSERNELFRDQGPLGSFSAKTMIGYAMRIFGRNTRAELDRIRRIRNAFAHARKPIRFDTEEVAAVCKMLITPARVARPISRLYPSDQQWPPTDPRQQYLHAAHKLASRFVLILYPELLKPSPADPEEFPLPLD